MLQIKSFQFSPIQENTYVLYNEPKKCIIIDPGCYFSAEMDELKTFIESHQLVPEKLLNTHCHLDHVFGNKFIADTYNLKLHLHEKEKPLLEIASASGLMFNLPFDNYQGEFIILKDGDDIFLDDDKLKVIEAPGHSPGSICFYCEKQHFIIGGDVLFNRSIGRTDLPGGDYETLINSINQQLFALHDNVTVYSGHGEKTTIGAEKRYNPFLK